MTRPLLTALALCLLALDSATGASAPTALDYRVVERKPQSRDLYVQGLEIKADKLYVSSGGYNESRLLRYDFASGRLETGLRLHPQLWAEGLTVLGEQIFQLTWRSKLLLVFDREPLAFSHRFAIPGQGWGLTHNGRHLIYSDGSQLLYYLSPETGQRLGTIAVSEQGQALDCLNELEWIDGYIWANVWPGNRIVTIDPASGEVVASLDLTGLLPARERRADTDVLNGIAWDARQRQLWVTGKRWPWLYRLEVSPALPARVPATESPPAPAMQYNGEPQAQPCHYLAPTTEKSNE